MNILFFLIPKSKVAFVFTDSSLRQVSEKMTYHNYTSIPVLDHEGHYVSTVSEGDLFRFIKSKEELNYRKAEETPMSQVGHEREVQAIRYDSDMDSLLDLAVNQNFVPVMDEQGIFMGIITRKAILTYAKGELAKMRNESQPKK
ncbi:MAG: CBS domain-containing protein [Bacilli bacterium]|jgi:CBS domain-containing protein|nr:CBS domain-containing protein [Bacilli bacterium]